MPLKSPWPTARSTLLSPACTFLKKIRIEYMPDSIEELSYSQALAELEQIVATLRGNNCDIDRLTALTRRASELLLECRRRLTATEGELEQILAGLEAAAGE